MKKPSARGGLVKAVLAAALATGGCVAEDYNDPLVRGFEESKPSWLQTGAYRGWQAKYGNNSQRRNVQSRFSSGSRSNTHHVPSILCLCFGFSHLWARYGDV